MASRLPGFLRWLSHLNVSSALSGGLANWKTSGLALQNLFAKSWPVPSLFPALLGTHTDSGACLRGLNKRKNRMRTCQHGSCMQRDRPLPLGHLLGAFCRTVCWVWWAWFLFARCCGVYRQVSSITSSEECQSLRIFNVFFVCVCCKIELTICSQTARNELLNSELCHMWALS